MGILSTLWGLNDPKYTTGFRKFLPSDEPIEPAAIELSNDATIQQDRTKLVKNSMGKASSDSAGSTSSVRSDENSKAESQLLKGSAISDSNSKSPVSILEPDKESINSKLGNDLLASKDQTSLTQSMTYTKSFATDNDSGKKSIFRKALNKSTHGVVLNDTLKDVTADTSIRVNIVINKIKQYGTVAQQKVNSSTTIIAYRMAFVDLLENLTRIIFRVIVKVVFFIRDMISGTLSLFYSSCLIPLDFILIFAHSTFLDWAYKLLDSRRAKISKAAADDTQEGISDSGISLEKPVPDKENLTEHKYNSLEKLTETRFLFWTGKPISIRAYFMDNFQHERLTSTKDDLLKNNIPSTYSLSRSGFARNFGTDNQEYVVSGAEEKNNTDQDQQLKMSESFDLAKKNQTNKFQFGNPSFLQQNISENSQIFSKNAINSNWNENYSKDQAQHNLFESHNALSSSIFDKHLKFFAIFELSDIY